VLFGYYLYTVQVIGFTLDAFLVFVFSLGLNIAAFIADVTRSAISNTPPDLVEVGHAMGLSERQMLYKIVVPTATREMAAPVGYLFVETIKATSLASVISVRETVYVAQAVIIDTSRSLEVWFIVACIYCALVLPVMAAARHIERTVKRSAGFMQ
jgi:ABC-type amino acid transport system permease subunit